MITKENYWFNKKLYLDLIIFFKKKEQNEHTKKCIEELEKGLVAVEKLYEGVDLEILPVDKMWKVKY